jgi:hypothetical protein
MAKYVIQAMRGAPLGGAYSQGWRAGDFIFVSATGPIDPVHGGLVGDSIEQQGRRSRPLITSLPFSRRTEPLFAMWSRCRCI